MSGSKFFSLLVGTILQFSKVQPLSLHRSNTAAEMMESLNTAAVRLQPRNKAPRIRQFSNLAPYNAQNLNFAPTKEVFWKSVSEKFE
ncbi:hypothetical protein R8510_05166 [Ralstonia chuxiongensis]|nr:hypothetical protein R8510_05166 [Ralstonia chuxiongensis]